MGTNRAETATIAVTALPLFAYAAFVQSSSLVRWQAFWPLFTRYVEVAFSTTLLICLIGVLTYLLARIRQGETAERPTHAVAGLLVARWRLDRLLSLFWPPVLFAVLLSSFNAFKQQILPVAGFTHDALFARLDQAVFFGAEPWTLTHALFVSPWATFVIDKLYHGWFVPMAIGVFLCAVFTRGLQLRATYLLTYVLIWTVIGSAFAFGMASVGPCFYEELVGPSASFGDLMARLNAQDAYIAAHISGGGFSALDNQAALLATRGKAEIFLGGGISAMPSVHIALSVLFAIAGFKTRRSVGIAAAAYALVIWVGSIHLGWHYAVDGIVSAMLTLALWAFASRVVARTIVLSTAGNSADAHPAPAR